MKCFVVAYMPQETLVMIPIFKSVDEASSYCRLLFKRHNSILRCQVFSVGSRLIRSVAILQNYGFGKSLEPYYDDDDLPF